MSHCAGKHDFGQSLVKTVNTIYPKFWWKVTKRKIIRKYLLSREALSIDVLTMQLIIAENFGHFCALIITFVRKGRHHFSDVFTLDKNLWLMWPTPSLILFNLGASKDILRSDWTLVLCSGNFIPCKHLRMVFWTNFLKRHICHIYMTMVPGLYS